MQKIIRRLSQKPVRILGLMSGTSLDGLDIALVEWESQDIKSFQLKAFLTYEYPKQLEEKVMSGIQGSTKDICQLNFGLAKIWSEYINDFLMKHQISAGGINCIASHGQTLWHESGKSTLQLGETAWLREKTDIPVMSNFRERDIAAGGTGAPLIPFLDWTLFKELSGNSIALNLGGIANITCITKDIRAEEVQAWDTGPGNMVLNYLVRHYYGNEPGFDKDGAIARTGTVIPELLNRLLEDQFVSATPPKSTGREYYSPEFIEQHIINPAEENEWESRDIIRTVSEWTITSIAKNVQSFWKPIAEIDRVIVSGGGAFNGYFRERLASHFTNADIVPSSEFGIPVDAKESIGFAVLGFAFLHEIYGNLPAVTGANRQVILGKLTP